MEQIALGASRAGHAAEAPAGGWLCALLFLHDAPHVPASIVIHMHGVFVWVPLAVRAQPCRPGLRMKISARFEWVQSFSYANRMH